MVKKIQTREEKIKILWIVIHKEKYALNHNLKTKNGCFFFFFNFVFEKCSTFSLCLIQTWP